MDSKMAARAAFTGANLRRALMVALVVGSALNLINQPGILLEGAQPQWAKLILTYCVPFLVASYGAFAALKDQKQR